MELFEDAVPQKIEFFAKSTDLPLTLALMMDVSGSQEHFEKKHEKDLEVFLKEVLRPKDRAFMVCFGNHLRLVSDYTNSPGAMLSDFHEFDKGKKHFPEIGPEEERELGTAFYDSIYYSVTEKLAQSAGRKAILMFSDGEDNVEFTRHDDGNRDGTGSERDCLHDSLYTRRTSMATLNARNKYGDQRDGANRQGNGRGAYRCGAHGPAHLFPANCGRTEDFVRIGVLSDE